MPTPNTFHPKVLIIGAGIGGLTLGVLLERANVPFQIFESSPVCTPSGSAISLSPSVMPMFRQLGLLGKLVALSKPPAISSIFTEQQKLLGTLDFLTGYQEKFNNVGLVIARPVLCDLLLDQIPKEKIIYGKTLLSYAETGTPGITAQFSDGTTATGSILIGADGANSHVRQCMYTILDQQQLLPRPDKEPIKYSSVALVGQTQPLDPEKFPFLNAKLCNYESVLSDAKPYVCVTFPTAQNTICWMVIEYLDKTTSKERLESFKDSCDWSSEGAKTMAQDEIIRRIVMPGAGNATMGELMDLTPRELMSKVVSDEKIFSSWTHGRTALLGDACHKMSPSAGQGAVTAMLDSIILANYIEALPFDSPRDIHTALQAYMKDRFVDAKAAVEGSATVMLLLSKGWMGSFLRRLLLNPPDWLWTFVAARTAGNRPQVAFLPAVEDKGSIPSPYQPSLYLKELGTVEAGVCG